ncbi:uncharacterized protein F4812DRAFT_88386 [Daldinia caldariorum]|uniref:uncharacterized protein n=1 Tax=Daldinia caldariorum TaxID=326644 RepID=UPI002007B16F|nr:uncharacterized protein F4812DRAFT_88386 [Daldinia caldariorum]KAI1465914.1 hypothetical protein F4812DRAFT_88386 [Daldinia caldariorum]
MADLQLPTNRLIGQQPQQPRGGFPLFNALPTELQWDIWELTLPPTAVRLSRKGSPTLIELPQPPSGHHHDNIPDIEDTPKPSQDIVALRVCQQSRMIALRHLIKSPLSKRPSDVSRMPRSCISTYDIVDIEILNRLGEDVIRRKDPQGLMDRLMRQQISWETVTKVTSIIPFIQPKRLLFDMFSRRISATICLDHRSVQPCLSNNPDLKKETCAIRSSAIEEWVFGSSIGFGRVPACLRYFFEHHLEGWKAYNDRTTIGGPQFNQKFNHQGLCSRPSEILWAWVWLMHGLGPGSCLPSPLSGMCAPDAVSILRMFVTIMSGDPCPSCQNNIVKSVAKRYPGVPLERFDLLFVISRSLIPDEYYAVLELFSA